MKDIWGEITATRRLKSTFPELISHFAGAARAPARHHRRQDLPDTLKQIATEAVKTIWQAANEAATGEVATLRAESRHAASAAEAGRKRGGYRTRLNRGRA
ncbi:hypothetical protein AU476_27625 [Cupriavidus sp. UYMSc13B]|nr:hypothetical protein AU476_27625 [Cupriavidus sp. UYMSc13B]